jgi:hypothetical protein
MTQEDNELLLRDLSARLTYGVKIQVNDKIESIQGINVLDNVVEYDCCLSSDIEEVKPYLFPISSMTAEQRREYTHIANMYGNLGATQLSGTTIQDWFDKNHLDYRGLIPKGLAKDATGLNIY